MKEKAKEEKQKTIERVVLAGLLIMLVFYASSLVQAAPTGPDDINITSNETKNTTSAKMINISGGVISRVNLTASQQNIRWKAFIGWIDGRFTLDDASGSTIYDWSAAVSTGEVHATRAAGTPDWANVNCASAAQIESEDSALSHSGTDNISSTFTNNNNSKTFVIGGGQIIAANECAALNTYQNSNPQTSFFEEVILYDPTNSYIIFTTILEDDRTGYDGADYDFQMIVPENASVGGAQLPYYLYLELG